MSIVFSEDLGLEMIILHLPQAMIAAAKEQPKPAPTHLPPPPALPAAHPGAERARQQQQQEQRRLDSPYSQPSPANDSSQRSSGPARSK